MCSVRAHAHLNVILQPFHGHFRGRSSECTFRCCNRYLCEKNFFPHPFSGQTFRLCRARSCFVLKLMLHPSTSQEKFSLSGTESRAFLTFLLLFCFLGATTTVAAPEWCRVLDGSRLVTFKDDLRRLGRRHLIEKSSSAHPIFVELSGLLCADFLLQLAFDLFLFLPDFFITAALLFGKFLLGRLACFFVL